MLEVKIIDFIFLFFSFILLLLLLLLFTFILELGTKMILQVIVTTYNLGITQII